jgi:hypothetical protein
MLFPWVSYDPVTGAHLMIGSTLQKSLLQSAPWAILALILFTLAWLPRFQMPEARQRQTRLLSLVTLAVLAVFAFAGVSRIEGLSFNQRYLLELLPLAAVGFAWTLDGLHVRPQRVLIGALAGVLLVVMILWVTPVFGGPEDALWLARILSLLKLPLAFSGALSVLWILARSRQSVRPLLAATAGLCLGWGLALHVADDVATSHRLRAYSLAQTEALGRVLPTGSALVAYWGNKDAAVPLLFDRDIVILDAHADEGKDAPILIQELLGRGRRVFLLQNGFPGEVLRGVLSGWQVVPIEKTGAHLVELRASPR